jgi:hypothetical protein
MKPSISLNETILFSDINQVIAILQKLGKEAFEVSEYVLKTIIRC